jgi:hypothetical protein
MNCARLAASLLAVLAVSFSASGQSVISTHSGVVYFFEGAVFLGDQPLEQKFGKFPDVGEGRELRTEQGRTEVLLTPNVFLRMGENSRVRMLSTSLADTRVELLNGSAIVEATESAADTSALVIYKGWRVRIPRRGIYRIDAEPAKLTVFKGDAEVTTEGNAGPVAVKSGEVLPLADVLVTEQTTPELNDGFDHWAMNRSQAVYADNATAAQIVDDPSSFDNSGGLAGGLAYGGLGGYGGGLSYFPMTSLPGLGLINPYGLSFWSPFQPTLNALYLPGYGAGWAYPMGGSRLFQLYPSPYPLRPLTPLSPAYGVGVRPGPGGIQTSRVPVSSPVRVAPSSRPAIGAVHGGRR